MQPHRDIPDYDIWRGEISPELPAVARRADLVWDVSLPDGTLGILHIELQTKVEADIGERLAEYALRLWRREHRPVLSVVVFLRPAESVPRSPFASTWRGQERLRYAFDAVRLWEIPPERVLETPAYDLWPLASLMAGTTAEGTLLVADQLARAPVPAHERNELTRVLVLLAGMRLPRQALREALRRRPMLENLWEESSLAGALEDLAEERGIAAGKAEGMRQLAQIALAARFGPLDDEFSEAIKRADETTLLVLIAHYAVETLEQVRARLGLS